MAICCFAGWQPAAVPQFEGLDDYQSALPPKRQGDAFACEQFGLPFRRAGESAEAVTRHDAMAGNEEWDGIRTAGIADGAVGTRASNGGSDGAVGADLAGGNLPESSPDELLKFGAVKIERRQRAVGLAGNDAFESAKGELPPRADGGGEFGVAGRGGGLSGVRKS